MPQLREEAGERLMKFDPDLSPEHETNRRAAKGLKLTYDHGRRVYVDEDGCLTHDKFGQKL